MAGRKSNLKKEIEALGDRMIPAVRRAFMGAIRDVTDKSMLTAIADAIREGDLEKAFRATGLSNAAMRPVTSMIESAFERGGVLTSNSFPRLNTSAGPTIFRFDVRNSRAEAWLRDQSSGLVTRINEQTRTNIQTLVQAGMRDGRNPRNVALDIIGRVDPATGRRTGGIVGLTDQQAKWVVNARRELSGVPNASYFDRVQRDMRFDGIVRRAIKDGKPLEAGKVDALIGKYSDNLLQMRGETIARTEMLQSLARSQDEAIRQAIDTGTVNPRNVTKVWDAAGDKRTRASHAAMDGQRVGMDEAFTASDGSKLMIPGDSSLGAPASEIINCRCRVDYDIDFLADLDDEYKPTPPPAPPVAQPRPPEPAPPPPMPAPAPEPPGPPRMAYEDFVPFPNTGQAQIWMQDNIADVVALTSGSKIDGVNQIARATLEVNERFGMPKIAFIGDPDKQARYKFAKLSVAAYADQIDYMLMKSLPADAAKLNTIKSSPEQAVTYLRNSRVAAEINFDNRYAPEVLSGLARMTEKLWAVSNTPASVIYHEMGHRLHNFNRSEINAVFPATFRREGWHNLISEYAKTNQDEYVAEAFSLYMQGDEDEFYRIYPPLLEYFRKKDLKNVSN